MIRKSFILAIFLLPSAAYAQQSLLPALCQQVLTPNPETSVVKIITDRIVERAKQVPNEMVRDVEEAGDKFAAALIDTLEEARNAPTKLSQDDTVANVLGVATKLSWLERISDSAIGVLQTLLEHWVWTLAGLGTLLGYFLIRF